MIFWPVKVLFCALLLVPAVAWAQVCAEDGNGTQVCLPGPAQRIATLSPGATELMWAAGGGSRVVAVVAYSDYPPEATKVASVGNHTRMDLEKLISLKPDLVVGWQSGNPTAQMDMLRQLGFPVFMIEPRTFEQVSTTIERLSVLAGTESVGYPVAQKFRDGIHKLAETYKDAEPVRVFYQVWKDPLITLNDKHLIGRAITLCGGVNVFGELERLAPRVNLEAVLTKDPEAIMVGGLGEENRDWVDDWKSYPEMTAVREHHLFFIPPSLFQRPTPRMLDGTRMACEKLEQVRKAREAH
jgi:iron complex transport system substrate-binding protein